MDATAVRRSPAHIAAYLEGHNVVRAAHGVKPLRWSPHFANLAEQWADACNFKHTDGVLSDKPYGENIVAATGPFSVHAAMGTFIEDAADFNPHHPHFTHYTQVLWESTTELGCASSVCKDLLGPSTGPATLYVCLYNPPGNVVGGMRQNLPSVFHHS
ncbi:hypothetical protein AGABI2DRAFT_122706 [Agaricus bisporus var. bisporus H97]|uniref:hypothetical protein n=1 Tax=Agaricus bisporus var. bisporus (strain H97 / ATCC MYA-4626 / FGSC 10389) TaxID=936046 RepID=UPI00029F62E4|nr:hypothetical protein AGABI2DRAFT_122706 [Agaricus bisporus var. bisporus H97]EKV42481.1 hypothetical protein AGABI2DRAFT_122706 [Agaricus bisporus var. bisporus H97]